MAAFVVVLPEDSGIQAEDIEREFPRHYELVGDRTWLVSDEDCYCAADARDKLDIGAGRPGLVTGVTEYSGYGDTRLGKRLRKWTSE